MYLLIPLVNSVPAPTHTLKCILTHILSYSFTCNCSHSPPLIFTHSDWTPLTLTLTQVCILRHYGKFTHHNDKCSSIPIDLTGFLFLLGKASKMETKGWRRISRSLSRTLVIHLSEGASLVGSRLLAHQDTWITCRVSGHCGLGASWEPEQRCSSSADKLGQILRFLRLRLTPFCSPQRAKDLLTI